jgi:hypothetical protein
LFISGLSKELVMPAASRRARICHFAGTPMSQLRRVAHRATLRRGLIVAVVATVALALGALGGLASGPTASAASAPAATQCNPPAYPTGAGFQVTCTFTIDNTVTPTGATSSTITGTACLAAAGVLPPFGCTTTVSTSNQLVTSVNQCNGITYGGGSNVTCKVAVVNTVVAGTSTPGVSVNQCIGSGTGGGTAPTEVCSPVAATTGATVTQCNGSGNGGGAMDRVQCTETGGATALPVTITQCDGSSNGGGSTVTCTTAFTNTFEAATPTTTTAPATPAGTAPSGTASSGAGATKSTGAAAAASGSGVTGRTGASPGAAGSTASTGVGAATGVLPVGSAETGLGGASHSNNEDLVILGIVALIGSALASALALRRRQAHVVPDQNITT